MMLLPALAARRYRRVTNFQRWGRRIEVDLSGLPGIGRLVDHQVTMACQFISACHAIPRYLAFFF
jgi:hypothetical protein